VAFWRGDLESKQFETHKCASGTLPPLIHDRDPRVWKHQPYSVIIMLLQFKNGCEQLALAGVCFISWNVSSLTVLHVVPA
jgi:hypothetical protein